MQEIFADARAFMRENGNPDQWGDRFPTQEMLDKDLALHRSYVCEDNGKIAAHSDALTCKYFVQIQKIINAVPKKRIYAITPLG